MLVFGTVQAATQVTHGVMTAQDLSTEIVGWLFPRLPITLGVKGRHFDQEIVVLRVRWYLSFKSASSILWEGQTPIIYYAFDLFFLDGTDLRSRPLTERRKLLTRLLKKAPPSIRFSEELRGSKEELLQLTRQFQLEGLIAACLV
jgi:ATP-dependent DNA ligase